MTIDLKKLRIGTGFLLSGQFLQALCAFIVNLVLVRYLIPEEFGRFAFVMSSAAMFFSILSLNIKTIILRTTRAKLNEKLKEVYFSITVYETLFAMVLAILWLIFSGNAGIWEISLIVILGVRHWSNTNLGFFERDMLYKRIALVETIAVVTAHLLTLLLLSYGIEKDLLYIREIIITLFSVSGFYFIRGIKVFKLIGFWKIDWFDVLRESRSLWFDSILESSFNRMIIIFVSVLGGDKLAGFFFQAQHEFSKMK